MPVTLTALGIGAGMYAYGAYNKNKADKAAANNVRPTYKPSPYEAQSLTLAESQAGQGISDASQTDLMNNANAGLATTTGAILKGGGDANALGSAYNNYNTGINNMAMFDDQRRMEHLANLDSAYHRQSAVADKAWQLNDYEPFANRAQAIAQQQAGAQNMEQAGINTALSGVLGGVSKYASNAANRSASPADNRTSQGGYAAGLPMGVPKVNRDWGAQGDTNDYAAPLVAGLPMGVPTVIDGQSAFNDGNGGAPAMPSYGGGVPRVNNRSAANFDFSRPILANSAFGNGETGATDIPPIPGASSFNQLSSFTGPQSMPYSQLNGPYTGFPTLFPSAGQQAQQQPWPSFY